MKRYERTKVYEHKREPKYMFQWIVDHIIEKVPDPKSMLDIGAASGDFLDYASSRLSNCDFTGVEYDSKLVEIGNINPHFNLEHGDAENLKFRNSTFDVVTMTGTHSIFDDFRPSFEEAIRVTKNHGLILITGIFNDHPVDSQIYWKYSNEDNAYWNRGYNYWSKQTVSNFLNANSSLNIHEFIKFELPFDLNKIEDDSIRSWTETTEKGNKILVNAIMPLNFYCLAIQKI